MSIDAQPAGSSPAPSAPPPSFATYEAEQLARSLGRTPDPARVPDPTDPTPPADSSPAPAAEQPASTEVTEAASEAAKPRKTAEDRKRELDADIQARLKRRHELDEEIRQIESRRHAPPPPQETRPTPASEPAHATFPDEYEDFIAIPGNEHKSFETFVREGARFDARQEWEAQRATERQQAEAEQRAKGRHDQLSKFSERIKAEQATDPTFHTAISDDVKALKPFDGLVRDARGLRDPESGRYVKPGYAGIAEHLLTSDVPAALMRHFSAHPEDLHQYADMLPDAQTRALARLEGRLEIAAKAPVPAPRRTVTTAPDPGTILGKRPAEAADEEKSAVARRDFAAYESLRLNKELAKRGRG